jgi:2-hydroxy-3-keto-5-methylthiopentenyl-1-phosphate phosphatase
MPETLSRGVSIAAQGAQHGGHSGIPVECHVYVDFDGTIAPDDPTDALFARFADPYWRVIEEDWQQGRLPASDCMKQQVRLLRATPKEIDDFSAEVQVDPAVARLVRLCRGIRAGVTVVSDGLDRVIARVLGRARLDLPFFANRLDWQGNNRWSLAFPHWRADCSARLGNCKCAHRSVARGGFQVMVGDGKSDLCLASQCDLVLAKGRLAEHCRRRRIPHVEVKDISEAVEALAQRLKTRFGRRPPRGVKHSLRSAGPARRSAQA